MTTAAESIRTMFGSSRRLKCSRCKDFSTTNQAAYAAHLRECSGGSTPTPTSLPVVSQQSASPALVAAPSSESLVAAGLNLLSNNMVDPLSWQKLVLESAKQLQQQSQQQNSNNSPSLPSLASAVDAVAAFSNAANLVKTANPVTSSRPRNSPANTAQPSQKPMPLIGEEISSGERYGFREVFKHMYTAMVNGTMAYCCRLCPYQHAVRSRVTKHIRLQHFSKQQLTMFTCELCSFTTQHATELEHHRRRHAVNTKVYKCSECEYSTPMQNNFKRHLRRHTSSDAFVCSNCSFSSPHEATVKRHAFLYHRGKPNNNTESPGPLSVASDYAEDSNTRNDDSVDAPRCKGANIKVESGVKINLPPCPSESIDPVGLPGASNGVFVCDVCSLGFSSIGTFSQHRALHESAAKSEPRQYVDGAVPLDLSAPSSQLTETAEGILNLSTKTSPNDDRLRSPPMARSSVQRTSAVKRHLAPSTSDSSTSPHNKLARLGNLDAEDQVVERRYGCPVCSFEASDKNIVSQHLAATHPNQAVNRKSHNSQMARNTSAALLPIRCFSVTRPQHEVAQSTPLVIRCDDNQATPQKSAPSPFATRKGQRQSALEVAGDSNECPTGLPTPPASQGNTTPSTSMSSPIKKACKTFKCSVCGLRSNWKKSIKSHLKTQHRSVTDGYIITLQQTPPEPAAPVIARKRAIPHVQLKKRSHRREAHLSYLKLFNCRKCNFHSRRVSSFLTHCRGHFSFVGDAKSCQHCLFSSADATVVDRHELMWHKLAADSTPPQPLGFQCIVCKLEMPHADTPAIEDHVSSQHVPPALLALDAVRLEALYIPLA